MAGARGAIAWFGLGRFGRPIAEHLQRTGWPLMVGDPSHGFEGVAALRAGGALDLTPDSAVMAYALCVPRPSDVERILDEMVATPDYVVDFSTGSPTAASRFALRLAERGVRYLDAPVSGSIADAGSGALTTWVGADGSGERDRGLDPLLSELVHAVARNVYPMGSVGRGFAAKLVNQVIHIGTMGAIGDGFALARALGLDMGTLVASLENASADSAMLRRFGPSIIEGDFTPRFSVDMALKDVGLACEAAGGGTVARPGSVLDVVRDRLAQAARDAGPVAVDFSVIAGCPDSNPDTNLDEA